MPGGSGLAEYDSDLKSLSRWHLDSFLKVKAGQCQPRSEGIPGIRGPGLHCVLFQNLPDGSSTQLLDLPWEQCLNEIVHLQGAYCGAEGTGCVLNHCVDMGKESVL